MNNPWRYEDEHRMEICEWMRANGIDPGKVPAYSPISVRDGVIRYMRWVGPEVVSAEQPLTVEPSEVVARLVMWPHKIERGPHGVAYVGDAMAEAVSAPAPPTVELGIIERLARLDDVTARAEGYYDWAGGDTFEVPIVWPEDNA